jgi:hypothetical protein
MCRHCDVNRCLENLRMRTEGASKSKHTSESECERTASIIEIICLFACIYVHVI